MINKLAATRVAEDAGADGVATLIQVKDLARKQPQRIDAESEMMIVGMSMPVRDTHSACFTLAGRRKDEPGAEIMLIADEGQT